MIYTIEFNTGFKYCTAATSESEAIDKALKANHWFSRKDIKTILAE